MNLFSHEQIQSDIHMSEHDWNKTQKQWWKENIKNKDEEEE